MNKYYFAMNYGNILTAEFVGEEVVTCIDYEVRHVKFSLTVVRTYPFNACPHRLIIREPPIQAWHITTSRKRLYLHRSRHRSPSIRPPSVAMRRGPFGYLFPSPTTTTLSRGSGGGGEAIYGRGGPPYFGPSRNSTEVR